MDLENLLLGFINSDLTTKAVTANQSAQRESRGMADSTRRAFDGRMEADAATARVAAQNMDDGKAMVNVAQTYTTAMKSQLQGMQKVLTDAAANTGASSLDYDGWNAQMQVYADEIVRLAEHADFNGIKLMDGSAGQDGGGVVVLQAGNSQRDQKLVNMLDTRLTGTTVLGAGTMNVNNIAAALHISNAAEAQAALTAVGDYIARMEQTEAQYSYDYKSLENLSILFEEQADIFDTARQNASGSGSTSGTGSGTNSGTSGSGSGTSAASYLDTLLAAAGESSSIISGRS